MAKSYWEGARKSMESRQATGSGGLIFRHFKKNIFYMQRFIMLCISI